MSYLFGFLAASVFLITYLLIGIMVFTITDYSENCEKENILDSDLSIATITVCWPGWLILKMLTSSDPLVTRFGSLVRKLSLSLRR